MPLSLMRGMGAVARSFSTEHNRCSAPHVHATDLSRAPDIQHRPRHPTLCTAALAQQRLAGGAHPLKLHTYLVGSR